MGSGGGPQAIQNWSKFAQSVGCGAYSEANKAKQLSCLQSKPVDTILTASIPANVPNAARMWAPQIDNKVVFASPESRAARGAYIKVVRFCIAFCASRRLTFLAYPRW